MRLLSISAVLLVSMLGQASAGAENQPLALYEKPNNAAYQGRIDELVFGRLKQLGIEPAEQCSDGVFVRRVFLDVIGTLPTADEARQFLQDQSRDKRARLIDRLLERDEFADYWAMRWCDVLRVKAEFPINLWPNAAQAYHRWIHTSIRENKPYDRFARELLTANGSNFRVGQVNFFRAVQNKTPEGIAQAVALALMGSRTDSWPAERLQGMAAFFSQISYKPTGEWKEEIVFFDPAKAAEASANGPLEAVFPDGTKVRLEPGQDPRAVFADWLIDGDNRWFTGSIVNRIWCWLLGRGIVHEPDDIRPGNPPVNPELLACLERELVKGKYDLKHVCRVILNSNAYQLSSIARSTAPEAAANFASYPLRRLEAEVLIDALNQITGTTEEYSSPIPEPFTFIPAGQRSIALPDGSITSPFLEMFGRPPRDTGLQSERSNRPTADQRLHLLNSSHVQKKIEGSPTLQALFQTAGPASSRTSRLKNARNARSASRSAPIADAKTAREIIDELYLTILSRYPSPDELAAVADYFQSAAVKREAAVDLAWALINTAEFSYRH